jgi:hypothetical protein
MPHTAELQSSALRFVFAFGAAAWALAGAAHDEERLLVQVPAVYDSAAPVAESVRRECAIESLIGNHVFMHVSTVFPKALQVQNPGKVEHDKYLMLTVLAVQGVGGGAWSGGKSITIRADLLQDGKAVSTKVLNRGSRGGALGGFSGTCQIMERIAGALGRDTAAWLRTLAPGAPASAVPEPLPATEVKEPAEK